MANKVITNATIYTGKGVLENAFVRFDKQILEVGSMADFQADKAEEVIDAKGQKLVP
ncbi:N-acetylglucosamine-6-phosphate deacetylase, partial [Listeria monocytogenes]|nr:N-acetylglucosamine-6-phosphate deacetylase [Listeria monocytogenes]